MIKALYETHLFVENLERSIDFYQNKLGLELCNYTESRRVAFFWIGKPKQQMLGLWEMPKDKLAKRHFAFECDKKFIINDSINFLKSKGIVPCHFDKSKKTEPFVFAWMPAVAIYFDDPDGNNLEFISVLEGDGKPELGVISYEEWIENNE